MLSLLESRFISGEGGTLRPHVDGVQVSQKLLADLSLQTSPVGVL